jgi:ubiquinone/menaquinone biosynthesis C-methylase UbiE
MACVRIDCPAFYQLLPTLSVRWGQRARQTLAADPPEASLSSALCRRAAEAETLGCRAIRCGVPHIVENRSMKNAYSEVETANRYDLARSLPIQTKTLWLDALKSSIPRQEIRKILDLGCGTGRFTATLGEVFGCPVVGVEPSAAMLNVAMSQSESDVEWKRGQAENIPLESQAVDLVFMSQVFHHLVQPRQALQEINRVLTPNGYLAIRNGTREHNGELAWLKCFPEAFEIEEKRTPSEQELKELVCRQSFELISQRTIYQLFASSYDEYFEKISQRGLSSLIAISDDAFNSGLQRLRDWASLQPRDLAVYEPVDLFTFQKKSA